MFTCCSCHVLLNGAYLGEKTRNKGHFKPKRGGGNSKINTQVDSLIVSLAHSMPEGPFGIGIASSQALVALVGRKAGGLPSSFYKGSIFLVNVLCPAPFLFCFLQAFSTNRWALLAAGSRWWRRERRPRVQLLIVQTLFRLHQQLRLYPESPSDKIHGRKQTARELQSTLPVALILLVSVMSPFSEWLQRSVDCSKGMMLHFLIIFSIMYALCCKWFSPPVDMNDANTCSACMWMQSLSLT